MKAIGHYVIVRPLDREERDSGLVLPDTAEQEITRGEIVSVGESVEGPLGENGAVGMTVLFGRHKREFKVLIDGVEHYVYKDEDIYAVT